MPNPFTRYINQGRPDRQLNRFINAWDQVEELCVAVFQENGFSTIDAEHWRRLRKALAKSYPRVKHRLQPFWEQTRIEGRLVSEDPYQWILDVTELEEVMGNWPLMQRLPPAREAINRCLLAGSPSNK